MPVKIKICCIASIEEARMAIAAGASAIGLVARMPSGPGPIADEEIAAIVPEVPPAVATFLLTSETSSAGIIRHYQKVHTNTIQIVDALMEGSYSDIRAALPAVKLVQVIHVIDERSVEEAQRLAPFVDAILLDSGDPTLPVKVLGGTGQVHDWTISRKIRESIGKPLFLAGGLTPANVRSAIEAVEPFGIDVCSGVRTNGKLDPHKLEAFIKAVGLLGC